MPTRLRCSQESLRISWQVSVISQGTLPLSLALPLSSVSVSSPDAPSTTTHTALLQFPIEAQCSRKTLNHLQDAAEKRADSLSLSLWLSPQLHSLPFYKGNRNRIQRSPLEEKLRSIFEILSGLCLPK